MTHKHKVTTLIRGGLLDRDQIGRHFNDAELRGIAPVTCAERALRFFGQHAADLAVLDQATAFLKSTGQMLGAFSVFVEKMKNHALRRLDADAWEALQRLNQLLQQR